MAIDIALLVVGAVATAFVWRSHRLMGRQLSELSAEVIALRETVSRLFVMQLNSKAESDPPRFDSAPHPLPSAPTANNEMSREKGAREVELEPEPVELHNLCAKLITLVPPREAMPLLQPNGAPPEAGERRHALRHQFPRVGKILLHNGGSDHVCTVSNMSPAGALLFVADADNLPEQFELNMDGHIRRCVARWRRQDRLGVKFPATPAAQY